MESLLKIGELAAKTGVTAKTIRFYETAGVLPAPVRGASGYRLYRRDAADLLQFIKQARGLDLTLAEIKELMAIRRRGEVPCPHVYQLLEEKAEVRYVAFSIATKSLPEGFPPDTLAREVRAFIR